MKKDRVINSIIDGVDKWLMRRPEPVEFKTVTRRFGKKKIDVELQNANEHDDDGNITWVETGVGIDVNGKNVFFRTYSESEGHNIESDLVRKLKKVI